MTGGGVDANAGRADRARPLVAGVDIGGTKVAALVVDAEGAVLGRASGSMTRPSGPAGLEPVVAAIRAALAEAGAPPSDLAAIGIGVPGRVDPASGSVELAVNLGWRDVPLARLVEAELGAPCVVENDVRIAAAGLVGGAAGGASGEAGAEGPRSLAYLAIGTGIGAGLVLDGRLYRGTRGMAGEVGHVVVEPDGHPCACGQLGCLETVASGPAIARLAREALAAGHGSSLEAVEPLTARAVYDAARDGDRLALELADRVGRALGRAIVALVMTCDVERILMGGGVAAAGRVFLDPILAEIRRSRARSPLVAELISEDAVRLLPPGHDAVAWGGVALARSHAGDGARPTHDESVGEEGGPADER